MSGTWQASSSLRAPIFYDSNNTAYFTDPGGRSRQSSIDFGNGSYYIRAGSWGMRNQTPYGYIEFGPANSSHAHIYTDRTNFYFNKEMYIAGGTFLRVSDIRSNIFYDKQNTGYYIDPNTSAISVRIAGDIACDANYGKGLYGVYSSVRYQNVWSMGSSWRLPANGTTTGNLY
jgi:hypothetical protein